MQMCSYQTLPKTANCKLMNFSECVFFCHVNFSSSKEDRTKIEELKLSRISTEPIKNVLIGTREKHVSNFKF